MPASRSRTENWRRTLESIRERGGALEITVPPPAGAGEGAAPSLIWRVRVAHVGESEIHVEEPMALGRTFELADGLELAAVITLGQNRWMFRTRLLGKTRLAGRDRETRLLRLAMPEHVERCQRRNFYRVSTVGLVMPSVDVYPLIDPASVVVAETANRLELQEAADGVPPAEAGLLGARSDDAAVLPTVGPKFTATLMNIGGGGAGLMVPPEDRSALESRPDFWLRISLPPHLARPLAVSARLKHTHIDSTQAVYAGLAFEFGHNPGHQKFVVEQLSRFVALVQRDQMSRLGQAA
ncbi:MAG: hypothetical protein IBJ11_12025 [Phycisphaerales bacterium]|nr:hypothetical protein [Phycisphaerales bacterium]